MSLTQRVDCRFIHFCDHDVVVVVAVMVMVMVVIIMVMAMLPVFFKQIEEHEEKDVGVARRRRRSFGEGNLVAKMSRNHTFLGRLSFCTEWMSLIIVAPISSPRIV